MTSENLAPADDAAKRAVFVADLRAFANWIAENPWVPLPARTYASKQLNYQTDSREVNVSALATVRAIAARMDVAIDEHLPDRTRAEVEIGSVEYSVLAWHPEGRQNELERLRAEVAELRAAAAESIWCGGGCTLVADHAGECVIATDTGMGYSREPESTVVAPVPAGVEGHPEGRAAGIPAHYDTTADPSSRTTDCACGAVFRGATAPEAVAVLKAHIAAPELKPETVALVARVEAALPSQNTPEFTRIQERLLSTQVCTSLPDDEATVRMNLLPSGTSHGWQLSTEPENAPVPCADQPETHRHLIFDC